MPTLAVGMLKTRKSCYMPTASVGMAPVFFRDSAAGAAKMIMMAGN